MDEYWSDSQRHDPYEFWAFLLFGYQPDLEAEVWRVHGAKLNATSGDSKTKGVYGVVSPWPGYYIMDERHHWQAPMSINQWLTGEPSYRLAGNRYS